MSSRIYTLLLFVIVAMDCSATMLIPLRDGHYSEIRDRDLVYVYLKNGERKFLTDCSIHINGLQGTQYLNYPISKGKAVIPIDSISFIMIGRKNFNTIVPINPAPTSSLEKFDAIYIVLKNGELLEMRKPRMEGEFLREGRTGKGERYAGFHLDSIRTFAVEGVLDPWGNAVSNVEMDMPSPGMNKQRSAAIYGVFTALGAALPSLGAAAILGGKVLGDLMGFVVWSGFVYSGYKEGLKEGAKLDRNTALEKILRERARAREDSSSQRE